MQCFRDPPIALDVDTGDPLDLPCHNGFVYPVAKVDGGCVLL